MGIVRPGGPLHRLSRLSIQGGTTGLRAPIASTQYADLAAVSVGFWAYVTSTVASTRTIIDATDGHVQGAGFNGWGLQIISGSPNRLRYFVPLTTQKRNESNTSVTGLVGGWHYILLRDSNVQGTAFNTSDFVIDGVVDSGGANVSQNGSGSPTLGTARSLTVGNAGGAGPTTAAPLAIGLVGLWDHKVNDLVGRDLWDGASPLDFPKGLIGYWPLDGQEGVGFEPDFSGMGYALCALPTTTSQAWWVGPPRVGRRTLRRRTYKAPSGGTTFTQNLGGTLTPAGALTKLAQLSRGGTTTPTGTVAKMASAGKTGTITPTGVATKLAMLVKGGTLTPSGVVSFIKVALLTLGGTLTPSGTVTKLAKLGKGGTVTPVGLLAKAIAKALGGLLTSSGVAQKKAQLAKGGSVTPTGLVRKLIALLRGGTVSPRGTTVFGGTFTELHIAASNITAIDTAPTAKSLGLTAVGKTVISGTVAKGILTSPVAKPYV